jgi:excisionase family DNA binding protein
VVSTKSNASVQVDDPFYGVEKAADYLGQTERWVRRQVEEGKIRYSKMGNTLRFRKSWLDEYIEETTVMPEGDS